MNYIIKGLFCGITIGLSFLFFSSKRDNIMSKIAYETVMYYSYVEINVKNQLNLIYNIPVVKNSIYKFQMYMFNEVELIKSNFVFKTCGLKDVITYNPDYFDFFIYTDYYTSNKIVSKNVNLSLNIEKCDYRFYLMSIELTNVSLIDDENSFIIQIDNYYMVENIINKYFICYLIYKQYNVYLDAETVSYKLEIMDNNMDYKSITEKEDIILKKDKYIIKNYESLFKSDDKVSNHMNFINDDDFEVLKY
jgi:hypothetical protein